jgi:hypothetical protein
MPRLGGAAVTAAWSLPLQAVPPLRAPDTPESAKMPQPDDVTATTAPALTGPRHAPPLLPEAQHGQADLRTRACLAQCHRLVVTAASSSTLPSCIRFRARSVDERHSLLLPGGLDVLKPLPVAPSVLRSRAPSNCNQQSTFLLPSPNSLNYRLLQLTWTSLALTISTIPPTLRFAH